MDELVDPITLHRGLTGSSQPTDEAAWQRWPGEPAPPARPPRPEWAAGVRAKREPTRPNAWSDTGAWPQPPAASPQPCQPPSANIPPAQVPGPGIAPQAGGTYVPPPAITTVPLDPSVFSGPGPYRPPVAGGPRPAGRGPAGQRPAGRPGSPSRPVPGRPVEPEPLPDEPVDPAGNGAGESDGTYRGAAIAALVWCAIPVILYVGWALFLSGKAEAGCVDGSGQPCASPQVVAWSDLTYGAPTLAAAAVLSVLVALALRRVTTGWRSTTVGFASAVVGSGVVTVLWSALVRP